MRLLQQLNTSIDRWPLTRLVLAAAVMSTASLVHAQIGGLPEAYNSGSFDSDGTREGLAPNIKKFFGQAKGHYIDLRPERERNLLSADDAEGLANQFLRVFNDLPGGIVDLPDGNQITFASQTHDANNVALVVTPNGSKNVIAAAILHTNCGKFNGAALASQEFKTGQCENTQTFTIFWGKEVGPSTQINNELKNWITTVLRDRVNSDHMLRFGKVTVQVRRLA